MKRVRTSLVPVLLLAGAASAAACGGDDSASPGPSADAGGGIDAGVGADSSASDSGGGPSANVRVAHLSPDAPAVDFCLSAHGKATFSGPVLKGAGAATGIAYGSVTKYLAVPAAQYDVRLVAPGAADCSTSLGGLPDITTLPALPAGGSVTLAAIGELASTATNRFALTALIDDASVASGKAKLRFVHASPSTPAVDVGVGGGVLFTSIYTNVAFGAIGSGAPLDANGYLETGPLSGIEISARAHGAAKDAIAIPGAALPAGAIATAFAVGKIGDATHPLKVLLCVDNAAPNGLLAACSLVGAAPQRAHVRVAHLSPDAPAVDVCIKPHTAADYSGSAKLLKSLGDAAGLVYPQVTTYVDLPIGAYDLRVVAASASDCATGAVPDTNNVAVTADLSATIAALGDLTVAGSDPAFRLKVFVDDTTTTSGKGKLRFVHGSPGTPAVDVGLGSGGSFTKLYANVAFGAFATNSPANANGYIETDPFASQSVSARVANQSTDALTISPVSLPANAIATAFAIGGKTGSATNPLKVLLCVDNAPPVGNGLLTSCSALP